MWEIWVVGMMCVRGGFDGELGRVQSCVALAQRLVSVRGQEALAAEQKERARRVEQTLQARFSVHRWWVLLAATGNTIPMGRNVRSITFFDSP